MKQYNWLQMLEYLQGRSHLDFHLTDPDVSAELDEDFLLKKVETIFIATGKCDNKDWQAK